jgi:hypothetical protein
MRAISVSVEPPNPKVQPAVKHFLFWSLIDEPATQTKCTHKFGTDTLDNKFQKKFCVCDEYVINLFVFIYEVRKGT